jgi:hypothetical protein
MDYFFLALVWAYGKTNFVLVSNETITQTCETDIKTNLSTRVLIIP